MDDLTDLKCPRCKTPADESKDIRFCAHCNRPLPSEIQSAIKNREESAKAQIDKELEMQINKIICTTAPNLPGYQIKETLEIVTSECVFGMNMFRDIFASLSDVFGGRSNASQKILRDARKICLRELKKEAMEIGADAIIAIKLDYNEFSGAGKSMLFLVASGTAVKIEPMTTNEK